MRKQLSKGKLGYDDVLHFAKQYGTLYRKRNKGIWKGVDKLEAVACVV